MMSTRIATLMIASLAAAGCTTPSAYSGGYQTMAAAARSSYDYYQEPEDPSLFRSDTEILSDSAIRRILAYRLTLPDSNRIAILHFGERTLSSYRWSTPALPTDTLLSGFLSAVRGSTRVKEASLLPTMLVPAKKAVGYLREAAARYQADLIFVFRTDCQTFERYRFLAADEVKATCRVESVMVDTRTGIVPFTANASRSFATRKDRNDTNFAETVRRAEQASLAESLTEIGERTAMYLQQTP